MFTGTQVISPFNKLCGMPVRGGRNLPAGWLRPAHCTTERHDAHSRLVALSTCSG